MLLCSAPCLIHLVNRGFHKDQHIQILEQALHAGISAMCVIFSATIVPAAAYACCQDCLCVRTAVERHRQPATLCLPRQGPGRAVACTSVQSLEECCDIAVCDGSGGRVVAKQSMSRVLKPG
jgi:hypothetical protein